MNYFYMLPDDIQDYITEIKTKKEEKDHRISLLENDLLKLQDAIETTQVTENNKKMIKCMIYAYKSVQAWVILEDMYENPKEELSMTEYVLAVDKIRNIK